MSPRIVKRPDNAIAAIRCESNVNEQYWVIKATRCFGVKEYVYAFQRSDNSSMHFSGTDSSTADGADVAVSACSSMARFLSIFVL